MPTIELDDPYSDPRLVALYDEDNPDGPDHDFYRGLADELDARTIVDLGCGTGILTVTFARPGRTVIGVDPSAPMLDYARSRPGGDRVDWRLGGAAAVARGAGAQLAVLAGNVAQHIRGDDWPATLAALHDALAPGATLAFESRNPAMRAWENWSAPPATRDTATGPLTEWMQLESVDGDEVTMRVHNEFAATNEHLVSTLRLVFRSAETLTADLAAARLDVESIAGGFAGQPLRDDSPLLVVRARRR